MVQVLRQTKLILFMYEEKRGEEMFRYLIRVKLKKKGERGEVCLRCFGAINTNRGRDPATAEI